MDFIRFIPIVAVVLFVILFIYATTLYPGGSQLDSESIGFDWMHNYWCNLTSDISDNNKVNPARPYAILAMMILCFGVFVFNILFTKYIKQSSSWNKIIILSSFLSMLFAGMIFTSFHNSMILISSIFGVINLMGILRGLFINEYIKVLLLGCFCVDLLILNNIIYYSGYGIYYLPLIQKITFAFVLVWIIVNNLIFLEESR